MVKITTKEVVVVVVVVGITIIVEATIVVKIIIIMDVVVVIKIEVKDATRTFIIMRIIVINCKVFKVIKSTECIIRESLVIRKAVMIEAIETPEFVFRSTISPFEYHFVSLVEELMLFKEDLLNHQFD